MILKRCFRTSLRDPTRCASRWFYSTVSSLENLNLVPGVVENDDEMVELRRELHAHPELGFEETRTANLVAQKLESWGIQTTTGMGKTGVVGTLNGREEGACSVGFRADMDALPIIEETDAPYTSTSPGVMHACGHDGHTTMLLGAAKHLSATRNFRGKVHFIFQPNEEGVHWPDNMSKADGAGAEQMIRDGLFDKFPCDQVFGIHNWPSMPLGVIGVKSGPLMGSEDSFVVRIKGKGGHAAMPHSAVNPLTAACHVATALQTLVPSTVAASDGAVLTITQFNAPAPGLGAGTFNVIPEEAELRGTVRCYDPHTRVSLREGLHRVAKQVAGGMGAVSTHVQWLPGYPSTVNDEASASHARRAAQSVVGAEQV